MMSVPPSVRRLLIAAVVAVGLGCAGALWAQTIGNPRRLADGPPGQLLVAERSGSVVAVDKETLQIIWGFTLPDEGAPFGLATWNRLVFVGNTETRNVEVYRMLGSHRRDMELRFEYNLGLTPAGEPGPIAKPIAIGVDRREQLVFVLDGPDKRVKIFDVRGAPVHDFAPADGSGTVLSPVSLAVDTERKELLVGDYGDPRGFFRARKPARILIYDYQGELLFEVAGNGSTHESTQFARVQGLATTADGRIFAADPLGNSILALDRESGRLLERLGVEGQLPGQLLAPLDVLLDPRTGDLFVSNNMGARKVEVLRAVGDQP